jgi:hypothetical protein
MFGSLRPWSSAIDMTFDAKIPLPIDKVPIESDIRIYTTLPLVFLCLVAQPDLFPYRATKFSHLRRKLYEASRFELFFCTRALFAGQTSLPNCM